MGSGAQICIAYETLRDPARRREYDRSLGLAPNPVGQQWAFATPRLRWAPFIAAAAVGEADAIAPLPEPHVTRLAEPIAQERTPTVQRPAGALEAQIEELRARPARAPVREPEERAIDWKRPVLAVGGFVVAAGLIGAIAGMSVKDDAASAVADPMPGIGRSTVGLHTNATAPAAAPVKAEAEPAITTPTVHSKRAPSGHGCRKEVRRAGEVQGCRDPRPHAGSTLHADPARRRFRDRRPRSATVGHASTNTCRTRSPVVIGTCGPSGSSPQPWTPARRDRRR